jgi:hypothetical protein
MSASALSESPEPHFKIKTCAKASDLSAATWHRAIRAGQVRFVRISARAIRIPSSELQRILTSGFAPQESSVAADLTSIKAQFGRRSKKETAAASKMRPRSDDRVAGHSSQEAP